MELKRISEDDLVCLLHLEEENLHLFCSPETGASYLTLTSISLTVEKILLIITYIPLAPLKHTASLHLCYGQGK